MNPPASSILMSWVQVKESGLRDMVDVICNEMKSDEV